MGIKVFSAGFGRTGTLSLKLALEELGFGPCHHMKEVLEKSNVKTTLDMKARFRELLNHELEAIEKNNVMSEVRHKFFL